MSPSSDLIRASEIGTYAYCARAWWLQARQGVQSTNTRMLRSGIRYHSRHGRRVRQASRLRTLGYAAIAVAVILLLWGAWLHV
ncbi:MAG: hypothetical protein J7M34_09290 [Anaerolineae bacterium]|nr:hypothetical protein [Anaerolineae bacterium]